jgi:hypothetical protein
MGTFCNYDITNHSPKERRIAYQKEPPKVTNPCNYDITTKLAMLALLGIQSSQKHNYIRFGV